MEISMAGPQVTVATTAIETCPTKKKCFVSRSAGEKFEEEIHLKYPQQVRQYVYACEDCNNWHLTTQSPESRALARSSIRPIESAQPARGTYADKHNEVCKLKRQGMPLTEIAEQTGVPYQTVRNICLSAGLHTVGQARGTEIKAASTVESLSQQEQALEAQLRELQAKKQRLIEENALKLVPCFDGKGVVIKKQIQTLSLSFADAEELVEKLVDYLSEHNKVGTDLSHSKGGE
jgi:predicted transcriptional regulator